MLFGGSRNQPAPRPTVAPAIAADMDRVYQIILREILPQRLGTLELPRGGEGTGAYLQRLAATAVRGQDSALLAQVLGVAQELGSTAIQL